MGVGRDVVQYDFSKAIFGSANFDEDTDAFVTAHYLEIVAIDSLRAYEIVGLGKIGAIESREGFAVPAGNWSARSVAEFLKGVRSNYGRLSSDGRFSRDVISGLIDEVRRTGRIRVSLLPPELAPK